ncbi:MAG: CbiQ family ECF transporter T component, partial [Actinomycetota bacterium]
MTSAAGVESPPATRLGTIGHLSIFASTLAAVMLAPAARLPWAAAACLLVAWIVTPRAFRSLLRWRWLVMLLILALPPLFIVGAVDSTFWVIPYSSEGLRLSTQVVLRILVILVAVKAVTSSVDITSVAGLLERLGLRGLGFSMGVALNLLPALSVSAQNAWRSLQMRGGLRRR